MYMCTYMVHLFYTYIISRGINLCSGNNSLGIGMLLLYFIFFFFLSTTVYNVYTWYYVLEAFSFMFHFYICVQAVMCVDIRIRILFI